MSEPLPAPSKSWLQRLPARKIAAFAGALLLTYGAASAVAVQMLEPSLGPRYQVFDPSPIGDHYSSVNFASTDGVRLSGWLFEGSGRASIEKRRSVILVTGLQSTRATAPMPQLGQHFLDAGFDVLMFDLRGQGNSGSAPVTLGDKERFDVLGAYQFMKSVGYSPGQMAVIGVSMGGDATILASPQMPDVGAIIVISAYAELEPTVRRLLAEENPALVALEPGIRAYAKVVLGMDLGVRPVDVVRSEHQRAFLFIQGGSDGLVTPSDGQELYSASTNPETQEVVVAGVGHSLESMTPAEQDMVANAITSFISQQMAEPHLGG